MSINTLRAAALATPAAKTSLRNRLMFAASAGILTLVAPATGLYGSRAFAQTVNDLPSDCADATSPTTLNSGDGEAQDGETIECVSDPAGAEINGIWTDVDDLTLNVGDGVTETLVKNSYPSADGTEPSTLPRASMMSSPKPARVCLI